MPSLNISDTDFYSSYMFSEFVTHVQSHRNNQIELSSAKLAFRETVCQSRVKRHLDYAFSQNVQHLNISCLHARTVKFPLSIINSQSLKHLTLEAYSYEHPFTTPFTWELPSLTTLNLHYVTLYEDKCVGIFSSCANLKNLTLKNCRLMSLNGFNICHPGLTSLTLEDGYNGINVITPQLKYLTIKLWRRIHLISAPNLISLYYKEFGHDYDNDNHDYDHDYFDNNDDDDDDYVADPLQLPTELSHLEKVDICIDCPFGDEAYVENMFCLLHRLRSVKFLRLNMDLVMLLSSSVELISHQPSPFANLRSLMIYPSNLTLEEQTHYITLTLSTEVKHYLLDGSPDATFTMVSNEEILNVMNVTLAQNLMGELQGLLDFCKENVETNTYPDMKIRKSVGEKMAHIMCFWENLYKQVDQGFSITSRIIAKLQEIEGVLKKVSESHRDKLQARFSSLYAEAEILLESRMNQMMNQCNKKPRYSNVNELATSSHPSS